MNTQRATTARDLQHLAPSDLDALYLTLRADRLPLGAFDGVAWPRLPLGRLWQGKVFDPCPPGGVATVRNRIGRRLLIEGRAVLAGDEVIIDYPRLHLRDHLRPVTEDLWLGWLELGGRRVYFTLAQIQS